ncbi:hypothetical protein ACFL3F_05510, partial [Planctomycetota bacterium]
RATGRSYAQLVDETIARPIQASSFSVTSTNAAADGVSSSIGDLGLFVQGLLQETYISADSLYNQVWKPVNPNIPMGLGWDIIHAGTDDLTVSDDGDDVRLRTLIMVKPHKKTGIAILAQVKTSNRRDLHVKRLGHRLIGLLEQ